MNAIKLPTLFSLLLLISCSGNPFGESEIAAPDRVLSGRVRLNESDSAAGVYVWLEGFSLSTWSDQAGRFELKLPPGQVGGGNVTGIFKLYYYLANYDLKTTDILVRDGVLLQPQPALDAEGELLQPVNLREKLKIDTAIQPNYLSNSRIRVVAGKTNFLLKVEVSIQATRGPVVVFFPKAVNSVVAPVIFKNTKTGESKVIASTIAGIGDTDIATIDRLPRIRTLAVPLFPDDLVPGDYEIIPYLLIKDPEIPDKLIESLGSNALELGDGYLKVPFVRQGSHRLLHVQQ